MKNPASPNLFSRLISPYRGLGPSLWTMFLATMVNRFGDFVGAFLAFYLSRTLGYPDGRVGALVSLAAGASMVGSLFSGRIADALGRKRALLAFQVLGAGLTLATGFLYTMDWAPWLIVSASLFRGGARPLIGALLTDLSPSGRRKEVFGLQYWSINVGVALGPLAAGFLFDHAMAWLFFGDALCTLLAVILIGRGVHVKAAAAGESHLESKDERGAIGAFLGRPILLAFGLVSLLSSISYSQTGFGLPLTLSRALGGESPRFSSYLLSLNAVTVIVFSIPIARALRSLSPLTCFSLSGLFYVLGFGAYAFPLSRLGFALATFTWTIGEIVAATNMGVFLAKHSPENWRASFQSFMGVFYAGGAALGPLLAGPIMQGAGPRGLWTATLALCGLWAFLALGVDFWDKRISANVAMSERRGTQEGS
jgi:MFS family permease